MAQALNIAVGLVSFMECTHFLQPPVDYLEQRSCVAAAAVVGVPLGVMASPPTLVPGSACAPVSHS